MADELKVYHVGEYGEVYAARSEQEIRAFVVQQIGASDAEESIESCFEEIDDLDTKFKFNNDGKEEFMSWREIAAMHDLPAQISTTYN